MIEVFLKLVFSLANSVLPVTIISFYAKRRKYFTLRLAAVCTFYLAYIFVPAIPDTHWLLEFLRYIVAALLMVLAAWLLYDTSFVHALITGVSAYATTHIAYELYIFILLAVQANIVQLFQTAYFVPFYILTEIATYAIIFLVLIFPNRHKGEIVYNVKWVVISIFLLLFCILLNMWNVKTDNALSGYVYDIIGTSLTLVIMFYMTMNTSMKQQMNAMQSKWVEKQEFYELSKENMDALNRKCHDLKHTLSLLDPGSAEAQKLAEDIEDTSTLYDMLPKTDSNALNTILTEKILFCRKNGIAFTYMCDTKHIGIIDTLDLFTLLGNALDNACESCLKLSDPSKKIINLVIYTKNNFLNINVENHFEGEIIFKNGLPQSSKSDKTSHGFGTKSIQYIAQKYFGEMSIHTKEQLFSLNILIPVNTPTTH